MCIYLSTEFIMFLIFIAGLIIGAIVHKIISARIEPIDYYDGTHGMGYQPLANQGQQPTPPKSELPPLKKPKKGSYASDWNGPIPKNRRPPPKPTHNPHK